MTCSTHRKPPHNQPTHQKDTQICGFSQWSQRKPTMVYVPVLIASFPAPVPPNWTHGFWRCDSGDSGLVWLVFAGSTWAVKKKPGCLGANIGDEILAVLARLLTRMPLWRIPIFQPEKSNRMGCLVALRKGFLWWRLYIKRCLSQVVQT